jgi:citrate lyase subunit beta/citryl-CoA lyase
MRSIRCPIFVPGNRRNMLEKATTFSVDSVVMDLEDSVPSGEKTAARELVAEMAPMLADHGQHVMVRINALDTGLAEQDIEAVVSSSVQVISVGKITSVQDVQEYDTLLNKAENRASLPGGSVKLILWLESAPAIQHAYEIASSSPRITAITFGAEDYTRDLGIQRSEEAEELRFPRAMLALAAHSAGVTPLDTPYVNFRDMEGLDKDIKNVQQLGFKGKFAIHPAQIETIIRGFGPSPEDIAQANRVIGGWEKASADGRGSFDLDGQMVDVPVVERARELLEEARGLGLS